MVIVMVRESLQEMNLSLCHAPESDGNVPVCVCVCVTQSLPLTLHSVLTFSPGCSTCSLRFLLLHVVGIYLYNIAAIRNAPLSEHIRLLYIVH